MRPIAVSLRVALLFVLLISTSCSESDSPTETPEPTPLVVEGTVGASGGTLSSKDGTLSIIVPAGALATDTQIRIEESDDLSPQFGDDAVGMGFTVEPKGLQFAEAVQIRYRFPVEVTESKDDTTIKLKAKLFAAWLEGDEIAEYPDQEIEFEPQFGFLTIETDSLEGMALLEMRRRQAAAEFGEIIAEYQRSRRVFQQQPFGASMKIQLSAHYDADEFGFTQSLGPDLESDVGEQVDLGSMDPMPVGEDFNAYEFEYFLHPLAQGLLEYFAYIEFLLTFNPLAAVLYLPPGWTQAPPPLAYKVGFDFDIVVEECAPPDCDPGGDGDVIVINSDMTELENLRVAYTEVSDPTPFPLTGALTDPWLYVVGAEGVSYYRINREDDGRVVEGNILATLLGIQDYGVVPLATGTGSDRTHCLMMYGPGGGWRTNWNDQSLEYGAIVLAVGGAVSDVARYQSVSSATGAAVAVNSSSSVLFLEYDPVPGFYVINSQKSLASGVFEDRTGDVVAAYASSPSSGVVVVLDGSPGQVWSHDLVQPADPAVLQGVAGNDPRQIRGAGDMVAISNHGSDSITLAQWNHGASVSFTGTAQVGDGPIGIDILQRQDGSYVVLSTGSNDGTYTLTEVSGAGTVVSQTTNPVPTQCATPKHAVFVRGPIVYLAFSCFSSANVVLLETDLGL